MCSLNNRVSLPTYRQTSPNDSLASVSLSPCGYDSPFRCSHLPARPVGVVKVGVLVAILGFGNQLTEVIVRVDPRYYRPAEVETLLGDPTKAKEKLGWEPEITVGEMCSEMVANDLNVAKRHALLKEHGYDVPVTFES